METTISEEYHFGKLLDLRTKNVCKKYFSWGRSKNNIHPAFMKLSTVSGIWVQASVIAVLTLLCALVLVTSMLAEEMDERTKEEAFLVENETSSSALDDWLSQLNKLHILIEKIKGLFSPILTLYVFYIFVEFPCRVYELIQYIPALKNIDWMQFSPTVFSIFMLSLRLGTIVAAIHQLQQKVISLTG